MNKKIATGTGIVGAILILTLNLFWIKLHIEPNSPLIQIQYLVVLFGMLVSGFLLRKYYDAIQFIDYVKHGLRLLSTLLFLVIVGSVIIFLIFREPNSPWSALTLMIMKLIFSFSVSGLLSAILTSVIFNTFTPKK
jgi:hypothetical protein